jgi:hypothetical protein
MWLTKMKTMAALVLAVSVASVGGFLGYRGLGTGRAGAQEAGKGPPKTASGGEKPDAPRPRRAGVGEKPAGPVGLEDARDAVELAEAEVRVKRAEVEAAHAALKFARAQFARVENLAKTGAVAAEVVDERRKEGIAREGAFLTKEAELKQAEVRLRQAQRRLDALKQQGSGLGGGGGSGKLSPEQRLLELEKQLGAMLREVRSLRRELQQKKH